MAAAQPSYSTSCPNSHTTSNSYAYTTSQAQQQPYQDYTHHPSQPTYNRNIPFVRRLILTLILSFILISAISIISWLILHPRLPVVRVDSLSVSNFNLSDLQLTAKYEVEFTVTNPNRKISLEFEQLKVSVSYKTNPLSRAWVQPFNLGKMNQTVVKVELETNPGYSCTRKRRTAIDMGRDWSQGVVSLNVRMLALAKFKASDWLSKHRSLDIFCENLEVGFGSDNMTGKLRSIGSKDCSVYLL